MLDDIAEANDDNVAHQEQSAKRYVPVLVDGAGNDICAASTASCQEDDGKAKAFKEGTNDTSHELLFA